MNIKYIIIFNPASGKRFALNKLDVIESFFNINNIDYQIIPTTEIGHASDIAESYATTPNTVVVAAGGDGTYNEVINGLMRKKGKTKPVMGILPLGRSNNLAYSIGVPIKLKLALQHLISGNVSTLDIGIVKGGYYKNGRYFGTGIGIGFDTRVGLEAAKMEHIHGSFAYFLGVLKTLIKFSNFPKIEITYDDKKIIQQGILTSIMNATHMGGIFLMTPEAVIDDGLLDICTVSNLNRHQLLNIIFHFIKGTQKGKKGIMIDKAKSFKIKALEGSMAVHADGETICLIGKELEVECIPKALKIIK